MKGTSQTKERNEGLVDGCYGSITILSRHATDLSILMASKVIAANITRKCGIKFVVARQLVGLMALLKQEAIHTSTRTNEEELC